MSHLCSAFVTCAMVTQPSNPRKNSVQRKSRVRPEKQTHEKAQVIGEQRTARRFSPRPFRSADPSLRSGWNQRSFPMGSLSKTRCVIFTRLVEGEPGCRARDPPQSESRSDFRSCPKPFLTHWWPQRLRARPSTRREPRVVKTRWTGTRDTQASAPMTQRRRRPRKQSNRPRE